MFRFFRCGSNSNSHSNSSHSDISGKNNLEKINEGFDLEAGDSSSEGSAGGVLAVKNPLHINDKDTSMSGPEVNAIASTTGESSASVVANETSERTVISRLMGFIMSPWHFLFTVTIPDCSKERWSKWFVATFLLSCSWIGLLSWLLVYCATEFGAIASINPVVMGVVFLAAGTSVPDAISSIVVAREGMGNMAVANAIGSNVFDICLGLGLPYLISTGIMGRPPVAVHTENLTVNMVILLSTVVAVGVTLAVSRWQLSSAVSCVLLLMYAAFVVFNLLV